MPHSAITRGPGLYEFLIEAELQQYYSTIKNDLKVCRLCYETNFVVFLMDYYFWLLG